MSGELEEKAQARQAQIDASRDMVLATARWLFSHVNGEMPDDMRNRVTGMLARDDVVFEYGERLYMLRAPGCETRVSMETIRGPGVDKVRAHVGERDDWWELDFDMLDGEE